MTWRPRGVVVPAPLPIAWSASHAALPVVAATESGLRLFCSSRDAQGRSHIANGWLDLDRESADFDEVPAVDPGALGAFDDRGVTSSCVVANNGRLFLYYTGWKLGVTVPFYLTVGCSVSEDSGKSFRKASPAPVLGIGAVDPFLTASPSVLVDNGTWRMWYVSGTEWRLVDHRPQHRYHVKYAESDDGLNWRATGRVCIDYEDCEETAIARPCVIKDAGIYRMWFCSRGPAYQIRHAISSDGLSWERTDENSGLAPPTSGWDSEMQAYPLVFDHEGTRHMLYNGNGYGATGIGHAVFE